MTLRIAACLGCGKPVHHNAILCASCNRLLLRNRRPCPRCGSFLLSPCPDEQCTFCTDLDIHVDSMFSPYLYAGILPSLINKMKYTGNHPLAMILGRHLAACTPRTVHHCDRIVFPPMRFGDRFRRSFNQSRVFAEMIHARHNIRPLQRALRKIRKTPPQASLSHTERVRNLSNAFAVTTDVNGLRILLVDDVATTLTTINTIARLLKDHGAATVHAVSIARTTPYFI